MGRTRFGGIAALGIVLLLGSGQVSAHDDWNERDGDRREDVRGPGSVEMRNLDAYGEWVWDDDRGRGWHPRVEHDWRPYWLGHWAWRDQWVWVSADPWGDLPFHDGEWIWSSRYGWVWIPGTAWAPARVVPPAVHLHASPRHHDMRVLVPEPRAPQRDLRITTPREPIRPSHESRRVMRGEKSRGLEHGMGRGFERRDTR